MKITFVTRDWVSLTGGIKVVATYADRLRKRGHDVLVVCPKKRTPSFKKQVRSLLKGSGWINRKNIGPSHFDGMEVPRKILDHQPPVIDSDLPDADVVIASWWETAEWVAALSPSKGAKAYFIQHHEVHDYLPIDRVKATYSLPLHKITISNWLVEIMQTQYHDFCVSLVPNSVDFDKFYAKPRSKQSIPTMGTMYASDRRWKGSDITLAAFSMARQEIDHLRLVAFGHAEPTPELPLPQDTVYICQPSQERIREFYSQSDAWLFGSRVEGFGLPILEAMACRTPVIGTPAGAAPELLANGAGILVNPEDPEDMAKAIVKICRFSEEEWQQMSDVAYRKVTGYTWEDATTQFEAALYEAIKRTNHGGIQSLVLHQ
ncbi:MAG: glycosyltransferase family 4 protein [Oscillatoriales cyanobacterium RM2_1_1]|nr:glycosyltransferase family 4 protein [Oscillatoriales cyanobacterium SM2_3_0]NJO46412.1 glycosyltransferase family 4 protein [Oscillatoriales cyanobacterium RM2_1_1]